MKGPAQGGGEIVPVDGGHIIRSIGRKDRHSKVYTAKGPRDRRVRLSAHTAIQFYDVQDRLGYDRPSKAVDWLIRKAQAAIESLNETTPPPQPPWHAPTPDSNHSNPSSSDLALEQQNSCDYNFQHNNHNSRCGDSSFMGEADLMNTMKSFFPAASFGSFENVPCQGSASFPAEDLGLSLQTFQAGSHSNSDIPFHGSFQRIDGWNGGAGGIFPTFAQRELLQSNAAAANPWNQRPLISANHDHDDGDHRHLQPRNDFGLGFRVPARIYGEDEEAPENHR